MAIFKEVADIKPQEKMEDKIKPEKSMTMDKLESIMDKFTEFLFGTKTDEGIKSEKPTETSEKITGNPGNRITNEEASVLRDAALRGVDNGTFIPETNQEKGNIGEMIMDRAMGKLGYDRISVDVITGVNDKGHTGIDGVYYNPNGIPKFIIADAKYGASPLSNTMDGKQMSEKWIDARLDESVGKEKADRIREEKLINPENVGSFVVKIDSNNTVMYNKVDNEANTVEKDVKFNG